MKATLIAVCLLLACCAKKPDHARVRIAFLGTVVQPQQMPIALAETLGYYKDEGIDVTTVNLSSYSKTLEALIGGSVDVAAIAYAQTIQMAAEGQRVRAFFIGFRRMSSVLAIAPAANGKIRRVEDLKGAVIGIPSPGSPTHQWVNFILTAHGVRPSEVSPVGIGTGPSAVAAFESGRIDAVGLSGGDHIRLLRRNPSMRILVDGSSTEAMQEVYGGDLYASGAMAAKQSWLDRNPDTARRFARALQKTLPWIATHTPEEIREHLPESSRSQDASVDLDIIRWSLPMFTSDGRMPKGAPEVVRHFLEATIDKVRESKFDLATTWTNEFLPESK
jgi:NitT/TauT family transport system substrate-binding protein